MKKPLLAIALVFGISALPVHSADITFQTINFASIGLGNSSLSENGGGVTAFPYGSPSYFEGVPFIINDVANQTWAAGRAPGGMGTGLITQTFPMAVNNIYAFYTLANTWWGRREAAVTEFVFRFSDNSTYSKTFINGVDIRDSNIYASNPWAITINDTTTRNVYTDPSTTTHIDLQYIAFPVEHQGKNLVSFTVNDSGGYEFSRIYLSAATAQIGGAGQVVPEPSTYVLGGLATLTIAAFGRRRVRKVAA
jgi:hypothetical protein